MSRVAPELRYWEEQQQKKLKARRKDPTESVEDTVSPHGKRPSMRARFGQPLTRREREVFALYLEGHRLKEIGAQLGGISHKCVETHKASIVCKLGAKNDVDLVKIAIRAGYTTLDEKS